MVQHWAFNKNITPEFTFDDFNFETISENNEKLKTFVLKFVFSN